MEIFNQTPAGQSWYLNGWYYSSTSSAYGFITKRSSTSMTICTLFENGINKSDSAVCNIYWR